MRRLPRRRGISLGTVTMLLLTTLTVLGCFWLFPKLTGQIDVRINASELAVVIDNSVGQILSQPNPVGNPASASQPTTAPFLEQNSSGVVSAPTPTPAPRTLTLTAAGSVTINSSVQKAMTDEQSGYRFSFLFESLTNEIHSSLSLATLENSIIPSEKLGDSNVPMAVPEALRNVGFNALSFGHYDAFQYGVSGLAATKASAQAAGFQAYGAYASQQERDALCYMDIKGIKVALLSYQNDLSATSKKKTSKEEQAYVIAPIELPAIEADIQKARASGAEVVIVSLCWGKEGATSPTQSQKELAQGIAKAGADLILGTHSGVVQPVELISTQAADGSTRQTLCAYSLGNLFTADREKRSSISGILLHVKMSIGTNGVLFEELTYTPTYVWRGKVDGKTLHRVLISNQPAPDYVSQEQLKVMDGSLKLITEVMAETPVRLRQTTVPTTQTVETNTQEIPGNGTGEGFNG